MRVFNGAFAAATLVTAAVAGQPGPARLGAARADAVQADMARADAAREAVQVGAVRADAARDAGRAGAVPAEGRAVAYARAGTADEVRGRAGAGGHVRGRAGRRGGGHVYVWNLYGDERGRRDERPVGLVLSEHATLTHLHWSGWGGAGASGTGGFSGTMCLPGCLKRPYPAAVTLGRVRRTHGARYYTGFTVKVDVPAQGQGPSSLSGALPTP
jgi:hypothetical protein